MPVLTSRQMAGLGLALLAGALLADVVSSHLLNRVGTFGTLVQLSWLTVTVVIRSVSVVGAGLVAGSFLLSALQGRATTATD